MLMATVIVKSDLYPLCRFSLSLPSQTATNKTAGKLFFLCFFCFFDLYLHSHLHLHSYSCTHVVMVMRLGYFLLVLCVFSCSLVSLFLLCFFCLCICSFCVFFVCTHVVTLTRSRCSTIPPPMLLLHTLA